MVTADDLDPQMLCGCGYTPTGKLVRCPTDQRRAEYADADQLDNLAHLAGLPPLTHHEREQLRREIP